MDLLHLRYFQTVAQMQHMSKAAAALHIAQPSLSMMITKLEKELGVLLFDRQGRNIVLNDYGRMLQRHADRIVLQLEQLQTDLEKQKQFSENGLTLATDNSIYLLSYFKQFMTLYPEARLCQRIMSDQQMIQALLNEEIDLGFCQMTVSHPKIAQEIIVEDQFIIIVPSANPLFTKESLCFADIKEEPLVSLPSTADYINIANRIYVQKNCKPNIIFEGSQQMIYRLLRLGKGLIFASRQGIFMPMHNQSKSNPTGALGFTIDDVDCNSQLALCWKKDRALPPMAQQFKENLIQNYPRYTAFPEYHLNPLLI